MMEWWLPEDSERGIQELFFHEQKVTVTQEKFQRAGVEHSTSSEQEAIVHFKVCQEARSPVSVL